MDKEKKDFVLKRGVLGVGLPVALMMSIIAGYQTPGYLFRIQSFNFKTFLSTLILFLPIFLVAGYVWGIVVYGFRKNK